MKKIQHDEALMVDIPLEKLLLHGSLYLPSDCRSNSLVLFAHGSGSSRFSKRNNYVARCLNQNGLGTLLFDLLTEEEEVVDNQTAVYRFDIPRLAERLIAVTDWLTEQPGLSSYQLGYFGASTGAAAALIAAAKRPKMVRAVVSRGGRPDLADASLASVIAPTLLIVGGLDTEVIALNREAESQLTQAASRELIIVPGATHLFEEPGTLDEVAALANKFFTQHLS